MQLGEDLRWQREESGEGSGAKPGSDAKAEAPVQDFAREWDLFMEERPRGHHGTYQCMLEVHEQSEELLHAILEHKKLLQADADSKPFDVSPFDFDYAQEVLKPFIAIDNQRKRLLQIAGEDDGDIKYNIVGTWAGSVIRFVLQDSFFYIQQASFFAAFFAVFLTTKDGMVAQAFNISFPSTVEDNLNPLPKDAISSVSIAFSLFLSVYTSNQYKRFWAQYFVVTSLQGRVFEVATAMQAAMRINVLVSLGLNDQEIIVARRSAAKLVRFTNIAHVLGYSGLTAGTSWKGVAPAGCCRRRFSCCLPAVCDCCTCCHEERDANVYSYDSSWAIALFIRLNLMETKELYHLIEHYDIDSGGGAYRHMCAQAHGILCEMYQAGHINWEVYTDCKKEITILRGKFGTLFDYRFQSIPFLYVNTILLLTMM